MNFFTRRNQILLKELIKTDFKLRYQGSVIGYLWSILKPILLFFIMFLVFVQFMKFGGNVTHFAVALLLAITLWNFFGEATNMGLVAIVSRGDLLRKISFSKPVIILSVVANAFINLLISLVVVIIFALFDGVHIGWDLIFVPFLLLELVILATGISLILSTVYVYFRDISPIWEVGMQAGFYASPIIYPISQIYYSSTTGKINEGHLLIAKVLMMNPMAQIVQDMRYILTYPDIALNKPGVNPLTVNPPVWQLVHNPFLIAIPYIIPIIVFAFGFWIFTRNSNRFAEIV